MQSTSAPTNFRDLYDTSDIIILANIWSPGSARLAEANGATAIATTSAGLAWSNGFADGGTLPMAVHANALALIRRVVVCPVSADVENGYSDDANSVAANVMQLVDSGITGINIEDGHDAPETLCRKIEAIKSAAERNGIDLFINARTDVYLSGLSTDRLAETLRRAALYAEAGADGLFVPALASESEIETLSRSQPLPLNLMAVPGLPDLVQLRALGVRRLSAGAAIAQKDWNSISLALEAFLKHGSDRALFEGAAAYDDVQSIFAPRE